MMFLGWLMAETSIQRQHPYAVELCAAELRIHHNSHRVHLRLSAFIYGYLLCSSVFIGG